jgi:surface carbohydrate biosynthesis protein
VVVTPSFYFVKGSVVEKHVQLWRESLFFNLAWEQLFYAAARDYKYPTDVFAKEYVLHHAWGDFNKNDMVRCDVPASHIYVNGQPAYALYKEPYHRYFPSRQQLADKFGLDPSKQWVFFPENYGWGFYTEQALEQIIRWGGNREKIYALRDFCQRSFDEVIQWCSTVASQTATEVIVRPRPMTATKLVQWRSEKVLGKLPSRLHILKEGTVREWILASDIVISSYSTSLIEAAVANKSIYMLKPIPFPASLQMDWHELVPPIHTAEQFLSACSSALINTENQKLREWAIPALLSRGDAIENLTTILHTISQYDFLRPPIPSSDIVPTIGKREFWLWRTRAWLHQKKLTYHRLWAEIFQPETASNYYEQDRFTPVEVAQRAATWHDILIAQPVPA